MHSFLVLCYDAMDGYEERRILEHNGDSRAVTFLEMCTQLKLTGEQQSAAEIVWHSLQVRITALTADSTSLWLSRF